MPNSPISTYRRIIQILSDIRVIAWAVMVVVLTIAGVIFLPFPLITFLAGILLTLVLLSSIVYLTLSNERSIESLGDLTGLPQTEPGQLAKAIAVSTGRPNATSVEENVGWKVVPEIDLEPYQSTTGQIIHPGVFLAYDALDTSAADHKLFMLTKLRLRFDNQDTGLAAIRRVTVYLRREAEPGKIRETEIGVLIREVATRQKIDLDAFQILPVRITPYYELDCDSELEKNWARMLDDNCFLRVKVEATRQPHYCIDLNVDWETARLTNSVAHISLRRSGLCG